MRTVAALSFAWVLCVNVSGITRAADAQPVAAPAGAQFGSRTFTYKTVGDLKIQADVYRADDAQPRPVLVWLHGGALVMGSRNGVPQDLRELCRAEGYCLVSVDYRLAPQVKLPQIIEDVRDFLRWVDEEGPALFHADPKRVVIAGGSAGGYLTMMMGLLEPRPKALVAYYGYGDVDGPWYVTPSEHYRKQPLVSQEDAFNGLAPKAVTASGQDGLNRGRLYLYLRQNGLWTKEVSGFDPATEKKKLDPFCPVRNITQSYPPIVMLHGTADTDVPYQESSDMAEQLKKHNVRHELLTLTGAGHGLGGGDRQMVEKAMARAREFIKEQLGAAPAPSRPNAAAVPPAALPQQSVPELLEKIKNAPANTWIEIPKSPLMAVAPKNGQFPKTWAVCGPASVVSAWCGAAFDTKRARLVVWGGGHADYHGNELYAFDVNKLAWERLTDPFPEPVKDQEVNADGSPNSRHTYGGLAYLAHADRFFGLGGSLAGVGFAKCDRTWTYDFDAKKWQDRQPGGQLPGGGFCLGCAYDPISKRLYFGSEHRGLYAYDYDKNIWTKLDDQPVDGQGFAVDTKRNLLAGIGRGRITTYDIGGANFKQQTIKAAGAEDVVNAGNAAGFDYDPVADRLVGWASWAPGKVFGFDPDTKTWEARQPEGGPKLSGSARNGVFGRWRYVPSLNAFIAVSDAWANVFFYKYSAGTGSAAKTK